MTERKRSSRFFSALSGHLLSIIIFVIIAVMFITGLAQAKTSSAAQEKQQLSDNLYRSAVTSYALTGSYPDSLADLEENYPVKYDKTKYTVQYTVFASNIMPEIYVYENPQGGVRS
jgi:type II secretory pathway pseudopilin PulG